MAQRRLRNCSCALLSVPALRRLMAWDSVVYPVAVQRMKAARVDTGKILAKCVKTDL